MNLTLITLVGLKTAFLAYVARNYTLVSKDRKDRRIK